MRFLYVGIDPVDFTSESFQQNVLDQFGGVRQLGNCVDYICRDCGKILSVVNGREKQTEFSGSRCADREFFEYVLHLLEKEDYDYLYMRSRLLYPEQVRMSQCVKIKKFGARVIYEPSCWPVENYLRGQLRQSKKTGRAFQSLRISSEILRQRARGASLFNWADTAVVFGRPEHTVWGIPAIVECGGLSVGKVHTRSSCETLESPITMLAVVEDPHICGFERLLRGLEAYRSRPIREPVTLDIVGRDEDVANLRAVAEQCHVAESVNFLGAKSLAEINDLCNTHTVAVSSLGLYRADQIYYSPFLTKMFSAAGIPFIYAYEDVGLFGKVPFALKMPNLDALISMELVGEFVWRCRFNAGLAQQERRFAEEHYDWRVIMKQILLFSATGKLEA